MNLKTCLQHILPQANYRVISNSLFHSQQHHVPIFRGSHGHNAPSVRGNGRAPNVRGHGHAPKVHARGSENGHHSYPSLHFPLKEKKEKENNI